MSTKKTFSTLRLYFLFFLVCLSCLAYSQTNDDKIIIQNKLDVYTYKHNKGNVYIEQNMHTIYECLTASRMSVVEFYNDYTKIEKVKIKGQKGTITPKYSMWQSGDIFYSDAKICYFDLLFLRKGDTSDVLFDIRYDNPLYFSTIYFSEPEFVKNKTVKIVVPSWMKVELQERNFAGYNIAKKIDIDPKNGAYTYSYTCAEVAAMKKEPNSQGGSYLYPHILVLNKSAEIDGQKKVFFESLADQYAWYREIVSSVDNDQAVIEAVAKEITKTCATNEERIKTLFAWVQDNIRYIAFEDGMAGFKPDNAQEVYRKRYGDCKGMANLLKTMLQTMGFDARLTWLGTNHIAYDYSTPSLIVDNHMICTLIYGGEHYYLDPTVKYMPLGEYPQSIQGRQVLIENGENYLLERVPVFSAQLNVDSLFCEYTIVDDQLVGTAVQTYSGEAKQVILSLMDATPKDKLLNELKSFFERGNVQNIVSDIQIIGAGSQTKEVEMLYNIRNNVSIQAVGDEYYIDPNPDKYLMKGEIDIKNRINNMLFSHKRHNVCHIVINIPEGYKIEDLPSDLTIDKENYSFCLRYEQSENKIVYVSTITIKNTLLEKERFEEWNKDIALLRKGYMEQIVLLKN